MTTLAQDRLGFCASMIVTCIVLSGMLALAFSPPLDTDRPEDPLWEGDRLEFPEGAPIPRDLTRTEMRYLAHFPLITPRSAPGAPTGPVRCPAEYEPMEGILVAWEGDNSWKDILAEMAFYITTTGDADLYVMVDSLLEQSSANATLSAAGVDMDRVRYCVVTTDTIWIRDYGPRYIYQGNCRAIVDHIYNRPRPWDDIQPSYFSEFKHHAMYDLPLIHGGGNYHLDALGDGHASELVLNENPSKSEQEIHDLWQDFQNVDTNFHEPLPDYIDSTQHIDMWLQVISDDAVIISDWPNDVGSIQDQICDAAAVWFEDFGYIVHRIPARRVSYIHYTYTNVVMCNDLVLIPLYTNPSVSIHNDEALAVWEAALPDKTIVQINSQSIIGSAGALHCIVMHLPEPIGGSDPTVYLVNPRGEQVLDPGDPIDITWISDDDIGVESIDILLSPDGGATFPFVIAEATEDDGLFQWSVPNLDTSAARLRLIVHDTDGHTGMDQSDIDFVIDGRSGDFDLDGSVTLADYAAFHSCLTGPGGGAYSPGCEIFDADFDLDMDVVDFGAFQVAFGS